MRICMNYFFLVALLIAFPDSGSFAQGRSKTTPSKIACEAQGTSTASCVDQEFRERGKPVMLPVLNGVAFGVSAAPDNPENVSIWMDNQTDQAQSYLDECSVTFLRSLALYDSDGKRLLTKDEQRRERQTDGAQLSEIEICSCCIFESIAPHTMQVVDRGNLRDAYSLSPGTYFIAPVEPRTRTLMLPMAEKTDGTSPLQNHSVKIVIPPAGR
jgi:hypothetical protein